MSKSTDDIASTCILIPKVVGEIAEIRPNSQDVRAFINTVKLRQSILRLHIKRGLVQYKAKTCKSPNAAST